MAAALARPTDVLSKCVDLGYPPWTQGQLCDTAGKYCTPTTLAPWHQACPRLIRADYNGDGVPWTGNGTTLYRPSFSAMGASPLVPDTSGQIGYSCRSRQRQRGSTWQRKQ